MNADRRIPVIVLTGYLGSGKTRLLQRLLTDESGSRTAVVINEFGEVSLDHLLVQPVSGNTVVLQNGCICCSVRSELRDGLRGLLDGRDRSTVPPFDRILIETTGLADPIPLVQTLVADPMLRHRLRLASLVATVDAMNGVEQLAAQPEARRQAATADCLVITKTDLCAQSHVTRLRQDLVRVNPTAPVICAFDETGLRSSLLGGAGFDPTAPEEEARRWSRVVQDVALGRGDLQSEPVAGVHGEAIHSFVFQTRRRIEWSAFAVWLSLLVHRHGRKILRIKGLLDVPGASGPVCLNAVQHFIHPPVHLDGWPDADHSSRLVFITQDLRERAIRTSLERMLLQGTEIPARQAATA